MLTIFENLQKIAEHKAAIKSSLEKQGKEPTDKMSEYAGLIDSLENPDEIIYCVTVDGDATAYAQLYGEEKVALTATANDIRENYVAVTDNGITTGTKYIPGYITQQGSIKIKAGKKFIIPFYSERYDYTKIQAVIALFNTKPSDSVAVDRVVIEEAVYNVGSTEIIATIEKDDTTQSVNLGIINNSDVDYMIKYFTYREEI